MDPLGNIPIFLSTLKVVPDHRRKVVLVRELLIALVIMMVFLFFGKSLISMLAIDLTSMRVSGGLILLIIALQMIFAGGDNKEEEEGHTGMTHNVPKGEPFIVPLAIPLVSGPSVLTTLLIFTASGKGNMIEWSGVCVTAWVINGVVLGLMSDALARILGPRGMLAVEKLMGMILATISTQMIMTGLREFLVK